MAGGCGSWETECLTDAVMTDSRVCVFLIAYEVVVREYLFQTWFKHTWLTGSHHLCKTCHGVTARLSSPNFPVLDCCLMFRTFCKVVISIYPCVCMHVCLYLSPQAKVDNEILDYRDLAAIPKVKAIYDIERPDLITYEPLYTTSLDEKEERRESVGEVNTRSACLFSCMHSNLMHIQSCALREEIFLI